MSKELTATDREFFKKVQETIYANPFSQRRVVEENSILGITSKVDLDKLNEIVATVNKKIESLKNTGQIKLNSYVEDDRKLIRAGILFSVFHKHASSLDEHIHLQLNNYQKNIPFNDGIEIIADLIDIGFTKPDATRHVALFFQMRRCFSLVQHEIVGVSASVKKLKEDIWSNVFTHRMGWYLSYLWDEMEDFSTLVLGPTGVGKTSVARVIGRSGFIPYDASTKRFKENFSEIFQSINLSQFPPSLMESELFGHSKGAFTGANEAHKGIFEMCNTHGSIFIDELGEIGEDLQVKLLNVLQERTFTPVGSHERKKFSGRVIGATNQDIHNLVRSGKFRSDLYYRLCSDIIEVPSLRCRLQEDSKELGIILKRLFHRVSSTVTNEIIEMTERNLVKSVGKDYAWPGNIRELEQAVRRMCISGRYDHASLHGPAATGVFDSQPTAKDLLETYAKHLYGELGTYEAVAKAMDLDARTIKKYL
jgi:transcriptional regulator with AAA-type ATPase domain